MDVVHLSKNDSGGGAGRAAYRLHGGLRDLGVCSSMFVRSKITSSETVLQFGPQQTTLSWISRVVRYAKMRSDFFPAHVWWPKGAMPLSDDRSRFAGEVIEQLPRADVYHFHWIAEFVDVPSFLEKLDRPIVWTLHDMNPLTGGCHYTLGCQRFEQSCGRCPKLGSNRVDDPSHRSWKRKNTAYQEKMCRDNIYVVSPSKWLAEEAKRSSLLSSASVYYIPHGLDHTLFRPKDTKHEQSRLGIPKGQKIVLFVAHSSTDPRKGFDILSEALADVDLEDVILVSIGKNTPSVPANLTHVHVGQLDNDQRLATLYSMADIFVIPSLQEAFGLTALEAMACGTPVVGFDAGGIPDMVRPDETGWLAETGNVLELREAIEVALENDEQREQMATRCREVVENEYTLEHQARQYMHLYNSILNTHTKQM